MFPDLILTDNCVVLYFTAVLREILTTLEVIKQTQQLLLLQMQRSQQPVEVPEVSGLPLATQDDLRRLEGRISNVECKQNLVCKIVAQWPFFIKYILSYGCL